MLRALAAIAAAVLAWVWASEGAPAQDGPRLALLIANEDYPSAPGRLRRPHDDAEALEAALREAAFTVRVVRDADADAIESEIAAFANSLAEAGPEGVGFFYYAGHGAVATVRGRRNNFMLPAQASIATAVEVAQRGVNLERQIDAMEAAGAGVVFVVYDACRNQLTRSAGGRGFEPASQRTGFVIAMSTMEDQTTPDDGAYALALATEITRDGLEAEAAFLAAGRAVAASRERIQLPTLASGLPETFCFISCPGEGASASAPPVAAADPAQALWEAVSGSTDPADFQVIIDAYPESPFAALAANRIRALEAAQAPPEPVIDPAAQIREAQRRLSAMGYYMGSVDGIAGGRTDAAVAAFRAARGVSGAGIDDALLVALRQAERDGHRAPAPPQPSGPAPGGVFTDALRGGGRGPEMVVIPAGSFTMGSPASEEGRLDREGPQRTVTISQPFAVGRYEVTWSEWDACVSAGGCDGSGPQGAGGDNGWGRGRRPVIRVDWDDAQAYVRWLSQQTGEPYRLLTEAEWEYAARAGTRGRFSWGEQDPTCSRSGSNGANFLLCDGRRTHEVGSYRPNAFGLYDMHGNVWEWTQDCWNASYAVAPSDGRAWESGNCSRRVLRGGSWFNVPQGLRSANRSWDDPSGRDLDIGFRLARTISP